MLDSRARKYVQPLFALVAGLLVKCGVRANTVTLVAFVLGLSCSAVFFLGGRWSALCLLWLSGILDVLDGSVARLGGTSSPFGALMDLVFDRVVESSFIVAVSLLLPQARLASVLLLSSIIFSFSVFLAVGALAGKERRGGKAFYYQAGLAERTETFLVFSVVILWPSSAVAAFGVFAAMIVFTGAQRMREAWRFFGPTSSESISKEESQ